MSANPIRSILVTRLRFMGDVILTTPVVRALRAAFPDASIDYLAEIPFASLLEHHPDLRLIHALRTRSVREQIRTWAGLRRAKYDLTIDLFGNPRSAVWTRLSGAPIRIGGDFRGRRWAYTHRVRDDGRPRNAIEFHLSYLKTLGIPAPVSKPKIHLTADEIQQGTEFLERLGVGKDAPRIAVHPGASWPAKRWMPERFSELADRLVREFGARVILTEGPGEQSLADRVAGACKAGTVRPGLLSLRELAVLLSLCDCLVANDCGPMHLAPAVGTRTVGIFGPGEPGIWFPYDPADGNRAVHKPVPCSRCGKDFCDAMDCLSAVSADDVFSAVRSSLQRR